MATTSADDIKGITSFTTYASGAIKECRVDRYNLLHTPYGDFIPQYTFSGTRKKQLKSISFYAGGQVKSIALEQQCQVFTSMGIYPAELVTFYEDGGLNSLFPLNGQIGFGWSEAEEKQLAPQFDFNFPFGAFTAKISGMRFYSGGNLKSLILWPGEIIDLDTSLGKIPARIGFKLYEDGKLESLEPAWPVVIHTPAGKIKAFDSTAWAVDATCNSVQFDRNGGLQSLAACTDILIRGYLNRPGEIVGRMLRPGLLEDSYIKIPLKLMFKENMFVIDNGAKVVSCNLSESSIEMVSLDQEEPIILACGGCS
jgi:hypothetical protein